MPERMKILHLPLKAEWYRMIESGEKTEEYREIKPYWLKRLLRSDWPTPNKKIDNFCASFYCNNKNALTRHLRSGNFIAAPYTHIRFHYGYTKRTMFYKIRKIIIGRGKPEWGAPLDRYVFIIELGNRIK